MIFIVINNKWKSKAWIENGVHFIKLNKTLNVYVIFKVNAQVIPTIKPSYVGANDWLNYTFVHCMVDFRVNKHDCGYIISC